MKGSAVDAISAGVTVLLVLALVILVALAFGPLERKVAAIKAAPVTASFNWPALAHAAAGEEGGDEGGRGGTWLNEEYRKRLVAIVQDTASPSPFERASLDAARAALMATGWFADPPRLVRESEGRVRVTGVWRVPAAVVRFGGKDRLVSGDGTLLEPVYRVGASGLKVILNPSQSAPKEVGGVWTGGDVSAALELLAALRASPGYGQIAGVDVKEYVSRGRLVLVTDRGTRVVWGGAPSDNVPGEPPAATKLAWIGALARNRDFAGRIDAGQDVLDLTNPRGIMIERTADADDTPAATPAPAPTRKP